MWYLFRMKDIRFISLLSCFRCSYPSCFLVVALFQGDAGLIPRFCEGLFSRIAEATRWDEASFRTEVR